MHFIEEPYKLTCPELELIDVKDAMIYGVPVWAGVLTLGILCLTGDCKREDKTQEIKSMCQRKRTCDIPYMYPRELLVQYICRRDVPLPFETEFGVTNYLYSCHVKMVIIFEFSTICDLFQVPIRFASFPQMHLVCPNDYVISIKDATLSNAALICFSDCSDIDKTSYVRNKCDNKISCEIFPESSWGFQKFNIKYECMPYIGSLIAYFNDNLINYNGEDLKYCKEHEKRQRRQSIDDVVNAMTMSLDAIIETRSRRLDHRVVRPAWNDQTQPVQEYGEIRFGNAYYPSYIVANIRHGHVSQARPRITDGVTNFLRNNMGLISGTDERGHLLAHSIGGPSNETFNFIPQTRLLNRGTGSIWRSFEDRIPRFLNDDQQEQVRWQLAVIYDTSNAISPYRPIGVCIQFDEISGNNRAVFESEEVCFSNDPNDTECMFAPNPYCRWRY